MEQFIPLLHLIIIISSLLSIIYSFGVVWRVEKKLDTAFKLFLVSIISFGLSEIFLLIEPGKDWITFSQIAFRSIFSVLFLLGILEMRSMIRKLDGEIREKKK